MSIPSSSDLRILKIRKSFERRILRGYDWIFSNELSLEKGEGKNIAAGSIVEIHDYKDRYIGKGYFNPKTLIAVRLLSRNPHTPIDKNFIKQRLQSSLNLREQIYDKPYYRLVHSESDGLPGLVIDRFSDYFSLQITTLGMYLLKSVILESLQELLNPTGIFISGDENFQNLENFTCQNEMIGTIPNEIELYEGQTKFSTSFSHAQKTGWYFDQRDNRQKFIKIAPKENLIDAFSYAGAWGISAAISGWKKVTCIDSSSIAIEKVNQNAKINKVEVNTICDDAFQALKTFSANSHDLVIIDPPALIKRKKDHENGIQAYYQLNRIAAGIVKPNGILISCSRSHHLQNSELIEIIRHSADFHGKQARIFEISSQSKDHPVHPSMPETQYLKTIFAFLAPK